ncbi:MAG TPA: DNA polymerase I [Actinomycetota bacterium]|nr:DNA polymerase I [Actinomycetota bacterium]
MAPPTKTASPTTTSGKAKKKASRPKLLLLDGYSLAFRAFYALPEDLATSDGTHTNAVFGFTSMLIKVMQDEKPDHIACCLDMAAPLERSEAFADYKTNRSSAPDTFTSQVPLIREVLKVLHIPIFELPGHEADDIIAFLAKCSEKEGVDVRIVTGDRDFFQIVNDNIHVLYNRRGISDIVEMDPKAVEERYGVPPAKYVDLKALEGDNSDNLPGVPGVGTKTAAKLVQRYGSAEEAVAHAAEQTPKLAENLAAHADQVAVNKQLSTLAEVPLDVSLDDLKMGAWDMEEVRELFKSLEFRVLLERLMSDLPEAAEGEGEAFELQLRVAVSPADLADLAADLAAAGRFAVDLVPASPRGAPRSLAFSWGAGETAFVPLDPRGTTVEEVVAGLREPLEDPSLDKVVHGGRAALLSLRAGGIGLRGLYLDTHVGTYLLDPGAPGYALEEMARKYSGRELKAIDGVERDAPEATQGSLALEGDPVEVEAEDASLRALAIAEVAAAVEPELERLGMTELYRTIEHPLIPVLARMEEVGIKIDLDYLAEVGRDLEKRIAELETECYELAGERINLGSPSQLRVLLYDKLGLKTTRRTKTGLSTDARALLQLVDQHEFVPKLLDYRELAKLKNTYIDALPPLVDPDDGRVHTTYDQTVAATGRLSSTNPNLMNIPIRTDLGKQIRRAFIPEPGHVLLSVDYSQIELRVMTHLSKDPILLDVFKNREDVHTATACRIFGVDEKKLTTKHRSTAKMVNYGLAYGMGAPGLAERLNVPVHEAQDIMDTYFDQFGGVADFLDEVVAQAHKDGFTTTMFGRRRYLPELGSGNPRVRAIGERQALNAPIQGSAADIMKLAMINVDRALQDDGMQTQMILTVHDELVFEVPDEEKDPALELVRREMTSVCHMEVPLEVDASFGGNWAEAKG